jgi:nucleoside-diphosphate-sugar epimerase
LKLLWHWDHEHLAPRRVSIVGGDVRNVKSLIDAMEDVDTVIHLASLRRDMGDEHVEDVNAAGTRNIVDAAKQAKVPRLITVGCLGAEARSAYPYLRSMGKAEEMVRSSRLNFTVLKSAVVYGEGDWLTSWLAGIATGMPFIMPLPHRGETRLQPIWVGDLAACIERCLNTRSTRRRFVRIPSSMTHQISRFLAHCRGALTETEIDALSYNRTTEIGSVHRMFGFAPAKMSTKLSHLRPDRELRPLPVRFTL